MPEIHSTAQNTPTWGKLINGWRALTKKATLLQDTKMKLQYPSDTSPGLLQTEPQYLKTKEQKTPILLGIFKTLMQTYPRICKYVTEPTGNNVQEIMECPVNYDKACDCSFETTREVLWEICRLFFFFFNWRLLLLLF